MLLKYVLLAHVGAALFMVGEIWFVQVVHYPFFSRVGEEGFTFYSETHSRLTSYVVGPPMLLEAVSALLLVTLPPEAVPSGPPSGPPSTGARGVLVLWMTARVVA